MPTPFETLALSGAAAPVYLLEIDIYAPSQYAGQGVATFSDRPFSALPDGEELIVSETTLRFATQDYTTAAADLPANTHYDGRQIQPPALHSELPLAPDDSTRVGFSDGTIVLEDAARELDAFIAQSGVDGRRIRVLAGKAEWPLSDFGIVFAGSGRRWWRDGDSIRISVRDNGFLLETALQRSLYAGTGGIEGDAALANLPRPIGLGPVYNATPILINGSLLIYQVNWRQIQGIDAVFDGGLPFTASGIDYPNYAALAAATIPLGQYATCLALGLFRLGSQAKNAVTVNFRGDAARGYSTTAAEHCERIILDLAGRPAAEFDSAAFADFAAAEPAPIPWYRGTDPITAAEALDDICARVFSWWGCSPEGLFIADQLEAPDDTDTDGFVLDEADIDDIAPAEPPSVAFPPPWRVGVGHRRCWTVQPGDGLTEAATQAQRQFIAADYRYAVASDGTILGPYRQAQDWQQLPALYDLEADAQAQAAALLNRYRGGMQLYNVTITALRATLLRLGQGGKISFAAEGLVDRAGRIVSIDMQPEQGSAVIQVWLANV